MAPLLAERLDRERPASAPAWPGLRLAGVEAPSAGGERLPGPLCGVLEAQLGHDFGSVRVHADAEAARSAEARSAIAYTLGERIAFAEGRYRPGTPAGRRLLAHELGHVVQFRSGRPAARGPLLQAATTAQPAAEPELEADAEAAARTAESGPSAATAGLRVALERRGRGDLWGLLDAQALSLTPPAGMPKLVLDSPLAEADPVRAAFGPFSTDDALRATSHVRPRPDWLAEALRPREGRDSAWDLWIVYENDGTGIVPNFGSGSDQGRTAALYMYAKRRTPVAGRLSRLGVTPIEMTTPRGTVPPGAPADASSMYATAAGPYSGVATLDVGVTVAGGGTSSVEVSASVGIDSAAWGKLVQDFIHTKLSDSPLFPWPTGTRPLAEAGITWHHTINDLTRGDFRGLSYSGRLEIDAAAVTGTRRTEGSLEARFVVRTARIHTPAGAISLEFSPFGALARGFVRYNDGRVAPLAGVEAGVSSSIMVNVGRVGLGLAGEMIMSTDPAFQTGLPAGAHPAVTGAVGTVESGPAGHHGTGQLILRIGF